LLGCLALFKAEPFASFGKGTRPRKKMKKNILLTNKYHPWKEKRGTKLTSQMIFV
jgi:hypothetical protein